MILILRSWSYLRSLFWEIQDRDLDLILDHFLAKWSWSYLRSQKKLRSNTLLNIYIPLAYITFFMPPFKKNNYLLSWTSLYLKIHTFQISLSFSRFFWPSFFVNVQFSGYAHSLRAHIIHTYKYNSSYELAQNFFLEAIQIK